MIATSTDPQPQQKQHTTKHWQSSVRHSIISESDTSSRSSFFHRIQRKPEERSVSKRSRKSADSIGKEVKLSGFYTKMKALNGQQTQPNAEDKSPEIRYSSGVSNIKPGVNPVHSPSLIHPKLTQKQRRRTPTPAHSNRNKRDSSPRNHNSQHDIELQLKINELQRALEGEKVQREAAQKRASVFQKKFKQKIRAVKDLQDEIEAWRRQVEGNKSMSFTYGSNGIDHSRYESREAQAKGTLQIIKKSYRQFRIDQLEKKNQNLAEETELLRKELQKSKEQNELLREQCQTLREEIYHLSQQSHSTLLHSLQLQLDSLRSLISQSQSTRETSLFQMVAALERAVSVQQAKRAKLQLKLDYINRKKNQQISQALTRKDKDISMIRGKLSVLARQTLELRKEVGSRKGVMGARVRAQSGRKGGSEDEEIQLELSPEHCQPRQQGQGQQRLQRQVKRVRAD